MALAVYLGIVIAFQAGPVQEHPVQAHLPSNEDLRHFGALGSPRLSPDGKQVLIRVTASTADGAKAHLWLVDVVKGGFRQLTTSPDSDKAGESSGEWMADGSGIFYLARRNDHMQLIAQPLAGGEPKPFDIKLVPPVDASSLPDAAFMASPTKDGKTPASAAIVVDVSGFRISPDGKTIALLIADPETPGEKRMTDAKADAEWVNHDLHTTRLYLMDSATSALRAVPVAGKVADAVWSHDGAKLFVVRQPVNDEDDLVPATEGWVYTIASDMSTQVKVLPKTLSGAAWTFDDKGLLFKAAAQIDAPPGYVDLYEYDFASDTVRDLSDGYEGSLTGTEFALRDGSVLQPGVEGFQSRLVRFGSRQTFPSIMPFSTPAASELNTNALQSACVYLGSSSTHPTALYYSDNLGTPARPLSTPPIFPDGLVGLPSKVIEWKNQGLTIQGLLYLPAEAAMHKVPMVVEVHGGPTGAFGDSYTPFIGFLVSQGWAVFRSNPRGSLGRGARFAAANKNDLGGRDFNDIMAGVDSVLRTQPIDGDRLALEGYSYGGEMAGFAEGKTNRFKAIVCGAPVIDQFSEYGTEDGAFYDRWFFGRPWLRFADAWRQSPLSGVRNAKTPFLLLQGESDTVDPMGQSQEMYRALRESGVPVELLQFPRENHGPLSSAIYGSPVREPWHGFQARQKIIEFLKTAFAK